MTNRRGLFTPRSEDGAQGSGDLNNVREKGLPQKTIMAWPCENTANVIKSTVFLLAISHDICLFIISFQSSIIWALGGSCP